MKKIFEAASAEAMEALAPEILSVLGTKGVVLLNAPMGAGKTTLTGALCRALGADDDTGSPTFSIINEYRDAGGNPIYHFDFYRIDDPAELHDLGVEDYFWSGALCFVEWPEQGRSLLPDNCASIDIEVLADGTRRITVTTAGE